MLRRISRFNDRVQAWLFDPARLAPTYPDSMITRPFPFNAYYDIDQVPEVDAAQLSPAAERTGEGQRAWRLEELRALPQTSQVTRLICVEGWSAIGKWGGVTFADISASARTRTPLHDTSRFDARTTTRRASTWPRRCIRRRC